MGFSGSANVTVFWGVGGVRWMGIKRPSGQNTRQSEWPWPTLDKGGIHTQEVKGNQSVTREERVHADNHYTKHENGDSQSKVVVGSGK